jgi:hypothetical protein
VNYKLTTLLVLVALFCFAQDAPRTATKPATKTSARSSETAASKAAVEVAAARAAKEAQEWAAQMNKLAVESNANELQHQLTFGFSEEDGGRRRQICDGLRASTADKKRIDLTMNEERIISLCRAFRLWY